MCRFFFVGACAKCTENSRATYTNDLVKERGIARVGIGGRGAAATAAGSRLGTKRAFLVCIWPFVE